MNSKSEKFKKENEFYINEKTSKIQYNKLCQGCQLECKQSYKVEIMNCCRFIKKIK